MLMTVQWSKVARLARITSIVLMKKRGEKKVDGHNLEDEEMKQGGVEIRDRLGLAGTFLASAEQAK